MGSSSWKQKNTSKTILCSCITGILWYVKTEHGYVVVQFYPWFKFYFSLFFGMVMYI